MIENFAALQSYKNNNDDQSGLKGYQRKPFLMLYYSLENIAFYANSKPSEIRLPYYTLDVFGRTFKHTCPLWYFFRDFVSMFYINYVLHEPFKSRWRLD